jgi:hypothetical protein
MVCRAVRGDLVEGLRIAAPPGHIVHEAAGPGLELGALASGERRAQQVGLERATAGAAEYETPDGRQQRGQSQVAARVVGEEAEDVGQQRVMPRERAVQVKERERRRRGCRQPALRRRSVRLAQAALPAAASCRSTYCRIPP